jgi:hypothetical protein
VAHAVQFAQFEVADIGRQIAGRRRAQVEVLAQRHVAHCTVRCECRRHVVANPRAHRHLAEALAQRLRSQAAQRPALDHAADHEGQALRRAGAEGRAIEPAQARHFRHGRERARHFADRLAHRLDRGHAAHLRRLLLARRRRLQVQPRRQALQGTAFTHQAARATGCGS